ncbi:unnamed protein product [Cyclocybe aegerita]|uniref:Uncharacterized protein n=1 Tax=Cyclocybe aegerita TaxID=1973307 RepID=A0A8S0WCI0_CYCAE|nr:unnamed protein product [Cyclocybe aegerita]
MRLSYSRARILPHHWDEGTRCDVGPRLHHLFDQGKFFFLPDDDALNHCSHKVGTALPFQPADPDAAVE